MMLTHDQIDALKEVINIGVGRAASMLNEMVQNRVYLQVPSVHVFSLLEAKKELDRLNRSQLATVKIQFQGPFSGTASLVLSIESASNLVAILTDEETGTPELDSVRSGTLTEVGNILINGVMGSIGNILKERIIYSFPRYAEDTIENLLIANDLESKAIVLLAQTRFKVKELQVEGDIIIMFEIGSFDILIDAIETINKEYGGEA